MSLDFASPLMLWGAALVSVPIVIHLLNRRRFVVRRFAAMQFLERAFAKQRRRLRIENLLLLLLRCLAILLAALAMAQPFVPGDSLLALVSQGRREVVMIVDRSGSTGRLVSPGTTVDDRMLDAVRRQIGRLSDERGDAVTVITIGAELAVPAPVGSAPSVALAALERGLRPPGGVADYVAVARYLRDRVLAERPGGVDIVLYTDLQANDWEAQARAFAGLMTEPLERTGARLRIVDGAAGLGEVRNLGASSLVAENRSLLAGETTTLTAVVQNHGEQPRADVLGTFLLDGRKVRDVTLEIPARGTATASVPLRVDGTGPHHASFALAPDELPFDDERTFAFTAREALRVLLVDGDPGGVEPLSWGTGYLRIALDPGLSGPAPRYQTDVLDLPTFEDDPAARLARADVVVLADVPELTEASCRALAEAVESGLPLMIWLGEQVDPRSYNGRLADFGLLPARLGDVLGDPLAGGGEDYVTLTLSDPPPPALELFADDRLSVLLQVPVLAWYALEPAEESRVLASFVDALGHTSPALVEGTLGRGRVVLVSTSPDDGWNLWPRHPPTWVPLVHELLGDLTAQDPALRNVPLGQAPSVVVDGRPTSASLLSPSGALTRIERPEAETLGARSFLSLAAHPLLEAGPWRLDVDLIGRDAQARTTSFALSALPEAREGDLRRIDEGRLSTLLDPLPHTLGEATGEDEPDEDPQGDGGLARALLWALLGAVVAESVLARTMGKGR